MVSSTGDGGDSGAGGGRKGNAALKRYRDKRRFGRTREPSGAEQAGAQGRHTGTGAGTGPDTGEAGAGKPCFVVQIHDASTMHFDFRLEVDGVLKSWSVPKGPSPDPRAKRLAVPTEDHPLEYREFEGVIADGEYGAGTVIVWDEGTYRPLSDDFAAAVRRGHAAFRLNGSKLHGSWALTRFRGGGDGGGGSGEAWLLVKENDAQARPHGSTPDPARARSARSRRTLKQVSEEADEGTDKGTDGEADAGGRRGGNERTSRGRGTNRRTAHRR